MPKYPPPSPDYITTHGDELGSSVLCTALLTLVLLSSSRLGLNKTGVGQVYPCTAR